jgi:hypothetical protein
MRPDVRVPRHRAGDRLHAVTALVAAERAGRVGLQCEDIVVAAEDGGRRLNATSHELRLVPQRKRGVRWRI